MRSVFRLAGIVTIAILFACSALAQDDKKERKEKITPAGQVPGRVTAVDGAQKTVTVEVRQGRSTKSITWPTIDDVKIRTMTLPVVYDEKGKPRKHTAKELKELKGKGNLPGYTAGWDDLKVNDLVSVTLGIKKGDKSPVATMIVIERMPK
jgi:hypothetical protein